MKKSLWLVFLLWLVIPPYVLGNDEYALSRIGDLQGLSNSAVISLYQDNQGFMWFGTYDGLNNFDGKSMNVYRTDFDSGERLLNNVIYSVNGADDDCLWISTNTGINRFSVREQRVTGSYGNFGNDFMLRSNRNGNTWVVETDDVYYYNTHDKEFHKIQEKRLPYKRELSFVDDKGNLWLFSSADNTVYKYRIDYFDQPQAGFTAMRANIHQKRIIYTFYQEGILSFIDEENDLYLFDVERNTKVFIRNVAELIQNYGTIIGIVSFFDDIIIAFMQNGLVKLEAASQYNETIIDRSIRIFSVYRDPVQDIIWLGTDGQGAMAYTKKYSLANHIMFRNFQDRLTRQVRSVYTDDRGDLWFGTKGDGLVRVKDYASAQPHIPRQSVSIYFPGHRQNLRRYTRALTEFQVFGLVPSRYRDGFWIGASDSPGLLYYSYEADSIMPASGRTELLQKVHRIYEENDSTLWIATAGWGLCKATINRSNLSPEITQLKQFVFKDGPKEIKDFFPMMNEGDSILWLGSRGMGLVRFDLRTENYTVYQLGEKDRFATNDILCIHRKDDALYLGTVSGLVRFSIGSDGNPVITSMGREQGFLNDMIHGILEDENGYLWLSTNKGLIKYNPENNAFHTYYYTNGIQIGEFSDDAYYKCPYTGNLFFGGIDGLLYLEQKRMDEMEYNPGIHIRSLTLGVEKVNLYDFYDEEKDKLTLYGNTATFSLSYVAPDFIGGDNYEYSYCLEKNGKGDWSRFSPDNTAMFQSLPHGNYTLKLRYKKDVFDTGQQTYTLHIRIVPPWYMTRWAFAFYICLVVFIAWYFIRMGQRYYSRELLIKELIRRENENMNSRPLTNLSECPGNSLVTAVNPDIEPELSGFEGNGLNCQTPEQREFASRLLSILEENVDNEDLGPAFIARQMAMSTRQYYRRFKEISDIASGDFIKNYRLDKGARLLAGTDWPVQKIIGEIGIQSRSYFHKEFTLRYGLTPGGYRTQCGKNEQNHS